jgi:hypothetical protein
LPDQGELATPAQEVVSIGQATDQVPAQGGLAGLALGGEDDVAAGWP